MNIDYYNENGNTLCFKHAVKAVIEDDETITPCVDDTDPGETGYFSFCVECHE